MKSSSVADLPILSTSGLPVSDFASGFAPESTAGERPARSSRYITEHSAHRPVAGHVELPAADALTGAAEPLAGGGGESGLEQPAAPKTPAIIIPSAVRIAG